MKAKFLFLVMAAVFTTAVNAEVLRAHFENKEGCPKIEFLDVTHVGDQYYVSDARTKVIFAVFNEEKSCGREGCNFYYTSKDGKWNGNIQSQDNDSELRPFDISFGMSLKNKPDSPSCRWNKFGL